VIRFRSLLSVLWQKAFDPFRAPEDRGLDTYAKPASGDTRDDSRYISQRGIDLIKHFEGCYLTAYKDSVGVWTIGYGHTGLVHKDGTVKAGRKITQAEAEELLRYDLRNFAKRVQEGTTAPLTDDQFAALVSFDFNTGGFLKSTLRAKLNQGLYAAAADELLKWDKAGGRTLSGLTRRRRSERRLFLGEAEPIVRTL
jgi:lysozyme